MLWEMSWMQFVEWMVFIQHEPLESRRADLRDARHAMMFTQANSRGGRGKKLTDYLFNFDVVKGSRGLSGKPVTGSRFKQFLNEVANWFKAGGSAE